MDKANTIVIGSHGHYISEETMQMMNKAQLKIVEQQKGKVDVVILNPSTSLLPELEYIGNGRYKFKER